MKSLISRNYINHGNARNASKDELLAMLDRISEVDPSRKKFIKDVERKFPAPDSIRIAGSQEAFETLSSLELNKTDINLSLKDIANFDFKRVGSQDSAYELYISTLSPEGKIAMKNVPTIYNAKDSFLDQYMALKKAANFALKADEKDDLLDLIKKYKKNTKINGKINKLRFIEYEGQTYLRAVVGPYYKLYDNAIAFYISISAIAQLVNKINKPFRLDNLFVTDSKLYTTFWGNDLITIGKDVKLRVGLRVQNSELGDGAAKFQSIYKIFNLKGNKSFTVVEQELSVIDHGFNPDKISVRLEQLHEFDSQIQDIVKAVKKVAWNKRITQNDLNYVTYKISHLKKDMPKDLKKEIIKEIDAMDIVHKTFTIVDLFAKLDSFMSKYGVDSQVIIEAKFAKWLRDLSNQN